MAEAGYQFRHQDEILDEAWRRYEEVWSSLATSLAHLSDAETAALFEGTGVDHSALPAPDRESLERIQKWEIGVATQDLDCYERHVEAPLTVLRNELETGLLEDHRHSLELARSVLHGDD